MVVKKMLVDDVKSKSVTVRNETEDMALEGIRESICSQNESVALTYCFPFLYSLYCSRCLATHFTRVVTTKTEDKV